MNDEKQKNILIFRIGQLGDTLISMPTIFSIQKKHPNHKLILLTDVHPDKKNYISAWDVLRPTGWFQNVIFYYPQKRFFENFKNTILTIKKLRQFRIEFAYNLSPKRKKWQIFRDMIFFKYGVGARHYIYNNFTSNFPKKINGQLPRVKAEWRRWLNDFDADQVQSSFQLHIPHDEIIEAEKIWRTTRVSNSGIILAFGPGSKMPAKKWPLERYAELGRQLIHKFSGVNILVMGGSEDTEIGKELCMQLGKHSYNFAGILSIYGSAAILKKCTSYIGNDTGTMHLAAMAGIPCVAIFSARDYPGKWNPFGKNHRILRKDTTCAGCMLEICPYNNKCLQLISVDEVFGRVKELIRQ